jgi:hypothetical protein
LTYRLHKWDRGRAGSYLKCTYVQDYPPILSLYPFLIAHCISLGSALFTVSWNLVFTCVSVCQHEKVSRTKEIDFVDDTSSNQWKGGSLLSNNLMKLGGSLGNVPQKLKKLVIKTWTVCPFSRVQFIRYKYIEFL